MGKTYGMTIAGCKRELPICPVSDTLDIAGFVMFGDVEITEAAAKALLEKCPEHDVVVTAESKGIPLAYEMARIGCRKYVVARKGVKAYMIDPVCVEVKSITTANVQKLYLSQDDREVIEGKRVLIVDDVIPAVRSALRSRFALTKNTAQTRSAIRSQVIVELEKKLAAQIIDGYGSVAAAASAEDPAVCEVEFSFAVAHGLNQIYLTAHITV